MYLSESPYIDTSSVDDTRAKLEVKNIALDLASKSAADGFYARLFCAQYPELHFASTVFHTDTTLEMYEGRGEFAIMVPLRGVFRAHDGQTSVVPTIGQLSVFSPNRPLWLTQGESCGRLTVYLSQAAMERHLEAMLGRPLPTPLEFDPTPTTYRNGGKVLRALMDETLRPLDGTTFEVPDESDAYERFREELFKYTLLSLRHNFSEALATLVPNGAVPAGVKRVIEYLHSHPSENVSLERLVSISSVPGRTLMHHFQQFVGTSPMRYGRSLRFEKARAELEQAQSEFSSVSEVANRWGFNHMGRFSIEYRKRFGELPSQTLARRKHRRG